jgi:hypothetical protein
LAAKLLKPAEFKGFLGQGGLEMIENIQKAAFDQKEVEAVLVFIATVPSEYLTEHMTNHLGWLSSLFAQPIPKRFVINVLAAFQPHVFVEGVRRSFCAGLLSVPHEEIACFDQRDYDSMTNLVLTCREEFELVDSPDNLLPLLDLIRVEFKASDEFAAFLVSFLSRKTREFPELIYRVLKAGWNGTLFETFLKNWDPSKEPDQGIFAEVVERPEFLTVLAKRLVEAMDHGLLFLVFCLVRMTNIRYGLLKENNIVKILLDQKVVGFILHRIQIMTALACHREYYITFDDADYETALVRLLNGSLNSKEPRIINTAGRLLYGMSTQRAGLKFLERHDVFVCFIQQLLSEELIEVNCSCACLINALKSVNRCKVQPSTEELEKGLFENYQHMMASRLIQCFGYEVSWKEKILKALILLATAYDDCIQAQDLDQFIMRLNTPQFTPLQVKYSLDLLRLRHERLADRDSRQLLTSIATVLRNPSNHHPRIVVSACGAIEAIAKGVTRDDFRSFVEGTRLCAYLKRFQSLMNEQAEKRDKLAKQSRRIQDFVNKFTQLDWLEIKPST